MYNDIEILGLGGTLDIYRILGFSKLVGLSANCHERFCISYLQRLERVMEVDNLLQKKATANRKVASSTSKGKRELRNLISSDNYDGS